jgi:BirA family biotin operon repressor/biotin-[acetyl-CoA-carboxylase] ligase
MRVMSTPLIADHITRHLGAAARDLKVEVLATTQSTNADLRARIADLTVPLLLATENQTAGRGRAGRSWHSTPGDSLCFSLAWPLTLSIDRITGLPLAAGVAVADALHQLGWPVQLKWPNDLLLNTAKLGGLLIETVSSSRVTNDGRVWVVIGVGINIHPNPQRDTAIAYPTAFLSSQPLDRNNLLAKMSESLCEMLVEFDRHGLRPFVDRWHALHAYQNQPVTLHEGGQLLHEGVARGINENGCLLLDTAHSQLMISTGDVSLRSALAHPTVGVSHAAVD